MKCEILQYCTLIGCVDLNFEKSTLSIIRMVLLPVLNGTCMQLHKHS